MSHLGSSLLHSCMHSVMVVTMVVDLSSYFLLMLDV